jgi:AhpC/TSA family/Thiol:disulfide interchange protein DsbD, N-terminal
VPTLAAFSEKHGITYPLLSDEGSATITAWGIRNERGIGRGVGIPYPGTFVLNRKGEVVTRSFEEAYQERATAASVLATLQAAAAELGDPEVTGKYLTVRPGQTDRIAAPGQRLTLVAEVTPGPNIHVYAPGQQSYIPVSLDLATSDDFKAMETSYPPPDTYFFAPLKESVKVYSRPFKLTRDVTLSLTREVRRRAVAGEALTVGGTLSYQACNDRLCFSPDAMPLTWTITLIPIER